MDGKAGKNAIDGARLELVAEFLRKGSWTALITRELPAPEVQRIIRAVIQQLSGSGLHAPNPFTLANVLANAELWLAKLRSYQSLARKGAA